MGSCPSLCGSMWLAGAHRLRAIGRMATGMSRAIYAAMRTVPTQIPRWDGGRIAATDTSTRLPWGATMRMRSASTTSWATCGSGRRTAGGMATTGDRTTGAHGKDRDVG